MKIKVSIHFVNQSFLDMTIKNFLYGLIGFKTTLNTSKNHSFGNYFFILFETIENITSSVIEFDT